MRWLTPAIDPRHFAGKSESGLIDRAKRLPDDVDRMDWRRERRDDDYEATTGAGSDNGGTR